MSTIVFLSPHAFTDAPYAPLHSDPPAVADPTTDLACKDLNMVVLNSE